LEFLLPLIGLNTALLSWDYPSIVLNLGVLPAFKDSDVIIQASKAPVSAWQSQSMTFTATSSTQVLSFLSQGTPDGQPPTVLLSGASVEAVPWETDTLSLVGSTVIFGLGLWARNKFTQKKLK